MYSTQVYTHQTLEKQQSLKRKIKRDSDYSTETPVGSFKTMFLYLIWCWGQSAMHPRRDKMGDVPSFSSIF